jgi:aminoglycoside 3-N-acetyltransferase
MNIDLLEKRAKEVLASLGLRQGDNIFVHSDILRLARFINRNVQKTSDIRNLTCNSFHNFLQNTIGLSTGSIFAPAFFYDYARHGTNFDPQTSLPDKGLGAYPQFLLQNKPGYRSLCPPVSIFGIGAQASAICDSNSGYGYGITSPWQHLLNIDAKFLFWNCTFHSMTFVHHVETLVGVPHLYNKMYQYQPDNTGPSTPSIIASAVRYNNEKFGVIYNLTKFQNDAIEANLIQETDFEGSVVYVCRFQEIFDFLAEKLRQHPFYLLDKTPEFIPGKIPVDGITGALNPNLRHTS